MTSDELVPPTFNRRFRAGDVLFHSRNLKKLACPEFGCITGEKLFVLRSRDASRLLPELLPFLLKTTEFIEYVNRMWAGSTNKFLNKAPLTKYEFALPPSAEQQRLARALCAAADTHAALRYCTATADRARDSLIVRLFERGTRSETIRRSENGDIPQSWTVEALGARFSIQLGKMVSEAARGSGLQTPYLRNANVQWNRLDLNDVATMSFTDAEKVKFALRHGDILACEGRHVGKAALWRDEIPGACYQKALHRIRATGDDLPEFLLHHLYYYSITGRFVALTGETTIPHLPAERLRAMLFRFPARGEQLEIVDAVKAFDAARSALECREEDVTVILRSLIAEAR
jgi:type I restriction enzyme S subunit